MMDKAGQPAPSAGIGQVKLKQLGTAPAKPGHGVELTGGAAAPSGRTEGGKGGEGGVPALPPSPPSNGAFLAGVVRDLAGGARAAVCSKAGDPTHGGWPAEAADDVDTQCPPGRNNYFNLSSFVPDEAGELIARKEQVSALHAVLFDDVGTKVDRAKLTGIVPTWEIETSPGNSQVGLRLAAPLTDLAEVRRLQDAITAANLSDRGASGAARWARLPVAVNGKEKYRDEEGDPFACRLVRWAPDVAFTVEQLAAALGLDLAPAPMAVAAPVSRKVAEVASVGTTVWQPAPAENPVVTALKAAGLYKRQVGPGRHDMTCPWVGEHTDGEDSGAAYFEPDAERSVGGFKCHHSHGDRYNIGSLLDFLDLKADAARGKARIDVVAGELPRVTRAAELALATMGGFFQSHGTIVVVRHDPGTGDVGQQLVGEPQLATALSESADWYKSEDGKPPRRVDPPQRNVQAVLKAGSYGYLQPLSGLARQPFFREPAGELVTSPGYDAESARYAAFDPAAFPMPEPTEAAARAALAKLDGLLAEFAFASAEDRSAALCAMLTAAVRPTLPVAPAFNITAATPGSGKSYLAQLIAQFAGPGAPLKVSYPATGEEATKATLSMFVDAPAAITFDDMQTDWLAHGPINRALTSDRITDRLLGSSRMVTVSTRSLILGTGNNVGPVRDMARRVVTIRLHHRTETPALLRYAGLPTEAVAASRGEYVAAALTIVAAWQRAGCPKADVPSIASFGTWSEMCRQPLLWLGQPDPATSLIEQLHRDPAQEALGAVLCAWHDAFGDSQVMLRRLVNDGLDDEELRDALMELPVTERGVIDHNRLGWFLKKNAGRVVGGLELQRVEHSHRTHWRVVRVEDLPQAA